MANKLGTVYAVRESGGVRPGTLQYNVSRDRYILVQTRTGVRMIQDSSTAVDVAFWIILHATVLFVCSHFLSTLLAVSCGRQYMPLYAVSTVR